LGFGLLLGWLLPGGWGFSIGPPNLGSSTLGDPQVTRAIEHTLAVDRFIDPRHIEVTTVNGIVTLHGLADTILAREKATRIAESIRGVRAVVNRIGVRRIDLPDDDLRSDIHAALRENRVTEPRDVSVRVRSGVVDLMGTVQSLREKRFAERLAKGVTGVREVRDHLLIEPVEHRGDIEIRKEIEAGLRWDAFVDDALIAVDVDEGRVALSGTIGSAAERTRAVEIAGIRGVSRVDATDLEVVPEISENLLRGDKYADKPADEIQSAVEDAFRHDPRLRPFHIDVESRDGVVTLRGRVGTLETQAVAEETAGQVVGVWHVRNLIEVGPGEPVDAEVVARAVREALRRDPCVDHGSFDVSFDEGRANLSGQADSLLEKQRAVSAASRVRGVVEVDAEGVAVVRRDRPKSDQAIREDIEQLIDWSPYLDAEEISVEVEEGIAVLTGSVDTKMEYQTLIDKAMEAGARAAKDEIEVREAPSRAELDLEEDEER
jgi:osmotically-inducible protein OsmY